MSNDSRDVFELVFEGPENDLPETLRKIKAAFLADLDFEISEVQRALTEAPVILLRSPDELEIVTLSQKLSSAGAKVVVVKSGGVVELSNGYELDLELDELLDEPNNGEQEKSIPSYELPLDYNDQSEGEDQPFITSNDSVTYSDGEAPHLNGHAVDGGMGSDDGAIDDEAAVELLLSQLDSPLVTDPPPALPLDLDTQSEESRVTVEKSVTVTDEGADNLDLSLHEPGPTVDAYRPLFSVPEEEPEPDDQWSRATNAQPLVNLFDEDLNENAAVEDIAVDSKPSKDLEVSAAETDLEPPKVEAEKRDRYAGLEINLADDSVATESHQPITFSLSSENDGYELGEETSSYSHDNQFSKTALEEDPHEAKGGTDLKLSLASEESLLEEPLHYHARVHPETEIDTSTLSLSGSDIEEPQQVSPKPTPKIQLSGALSGNDTGEDLVLVMDENPSDMDLPIPEKKPREALPKEPVKEFNPVMMSSQSPLEFSDEVVPPPTTPKITELPEKPTPILAVARDQEAPEKNLILPGAVMLGLVIIVALGMFFTGGYEAVEVDTTIPVTDLPEGSNPKANPLSNAKVMVGEYSSTELTAAAKCVVVLNVAAKCTFRLRTPPPPDLTPLEIVEGKKPPPWLRKVESETLLLEPQSNSLLGGDAIGRVFIDYSGNRARLPGDVKVGLIGSPELRLILKVNSKDPIANPSSNLQLELSKSSPIKFYAKADIPLTHNPSLNPETALNAED